MPTVANTRVSVFDRIVCAFDGSPSSLEAAMQAEALRHGLGTIELIGCSDHDWLLGLWGASDYLGSPTGIRDRFKKGRSICRTASAEILQGSVVPRLLNELVDYHATLVAVGATDHSRPVGIALGSVATNLLHRAPCSVLVTRRALARVASKLDPGGLRRIAWSK
jgi:nucleotide-binding universal stress UspA family protein